MESESAGPEPPPDSENDDLFVVSLQATRNGSVCHDESETEFAMGTSDFLLIVIPGASAIFYGIGGAIMLVPSIEHQKSAKAAFLIAGTLFWITGLIWGASNGDAQMITRYIVVGIVGAASAIITLWAITLTGNAQTSNHQTYMGPTMSNDENRVVGAEIIGNHQGGAAAEINSTGTALSPSVGADVSVQGQPGQSVTGLRVIQNGPGTGLRINQTGPGVGLRVTVGSGTPKDR